MVMDPMGPIKEGEDVVVGFLTKYSAQMSRMNWYH